MPCLAQTRHPNVYPPPFDGSSGIRNDVFAAVLASLDSDARAKGQKGWVSGD
jgi:hypothetical protein